MKLFALRMLFAFTHALGSYAATFSLEGAWDIAPMPDEGWAADAVPSVSTTWRQTVLPDNAWSRDAAVAAQCAGASGVWARHTFTLSDEQAQCDAALRWELIRWGFVARLNGRIAGASQWYAPGSFTLPRGVLRAGTNQLLLAIREWNSLPRNSTGREVLLPIGSARFVWGPKAGGIKGPLALEFHDGVRIRSIVARPDIGKMNATFAVRLEPAGGTLCTADVAVAVADAERNVIGEAHVTALINASRVVEVVVPLPAAQLWSPATTVLYTANVRVTGRGANDARSVRFGMRSFGVQNGHFALNGAYHPLRGANILHEWLAHYRDPDGYMKAFLTGTARRMNAAVFRTHTLPPLHWVADICDDHGTLLIVEMPLTYNYDDLELTPAEDAVYRTNAVAMCTAWVEELASHPSIIMWVSSNEPVDADPNDQYGWDVSTLIPAMKAVDPTRPVIRTGEDSPDAQDAHIYAGFWNGGPGECDAYARWRAQTRDPQRPIMCTEYLGGAPPERRRLWTGSTSNDARWALAHAMIAMEQTEAFRRSGFDCILPYMFRYWVRGSWREDAPTPSFAAFRSTLAPVAVSLDMPDRNFAAGSPVAAPVHLMNDLDAPVAARLACFVCTNDPAFAVDDRAYENAARAAEMNLSIPARGHLITNITFPLGSREGDCWLAAVLKPEGGDAVMSERPLHVLDASPVDGVLSGLTVRVLGGDAEALDALSRYGLSVRSSIPSSPFEPDVDAVISFSYHVHGTPEEAQIPWLNKYVADGGAAIMLARDCLHMARDPYLHFPEKPGGARIQYNAQPHNCASVFPYPGRPMPGLWQGMRREHLIRWNGLLNVVCNECIDADWLDTAPPARQTDSGPVPAAGVIVIEGEAPVASTFAVDVHDQMVARRGADGTLEPVRRRAWSGGRASLLCTRTAPPKPYETSYEFSIEGPAMPRILWVREQMRTWCCPYEWRIDDGPWHSVSPAEPMVNLARTEKGGPSFGWTRLGTVQPGPGAHRLDVRVTGPNKDGLYLLSFDCLMLAPVVGETLAVSGAGAPLVVRVPVGKGAVYVTTLLFDNRIRKGTSCYDPAAERLFVNLIKAACAR
ncbi:hypothetical protein GX586_01320 [bacterium]|nr:hypothetical protein [bacterium]